MPTNIVHKNKKRTKKNRLKRVINQPILSATDKTTIYSNHNCQWQTKLGYIRTNIVHDPKNWKIYQPLLSMTDRQKQLIYQPIYTNHNCPRKTKLGDITTNIVHDRHNREIQRATLVMHHFLRARIFRQKCWNRTFFLIIYLLKFSLFDEIEKKSESLM